MPGAEAGVQLADGISVEAVLDVDQDVGHYGLQSVVVGLLKVARDAPGPGVALRLDSVVDCYLQNVVVVL